MIDDLKNERLLYLSSTKNHRFEVLENSRFRWLCMDGVVHSVMDKQQTHQLVLPHLNTVALVLAANSEIKRFLELGLGGGSMIRFIAHYLPDVEVECVEISDIVIDSFAQFFNPSRNRQRIFLEDAQKYMARLRQRFDWIYVDLFSGYKNPTFLLDFEFYQQCWQNLSEKGVLHINVIPETERVMPKVLGMLAKLTNNNPLVAAVPGYQNQMIVLAKTKIEEDNFQASIEKASEKYQLNSESFIVY